MRVLRAGDGNAAGVLQVCLCLFRIESLSFSVGHSLPSPLTTPFGQQLPPCCPALQPPPSLALLRLLCCGGAGVVDVCLIPEIKFDLDKLCEFVGSVMERKDFCVVCVAEGMHAARKPRASPQRR